MRTDRKAVIARVSAIGALFASLWASLLPLTGGGALALGPIVLSSRNPLRAGILAAVLYAVSLFVDWRTASGSWNWVREQVTRLAPLVVIIAAAAVVWTGLAYGARAAGGADTFGYVSQSYLWLKGDLHIEQPLAAEVPWPDADLSLTPLGYRVGTRPHTLVPLYSPGLPLIMAGAHELLGACGPFHVTPLFAAVLIVSTFGLAYRLSKSRLIGSLAAVLMACSPAFTFNFVLPWSDTPATALWTVSLLLLTWSSLGHAVLAGCAAGLAILVRPNLVVLAAAGMLAAELWGRTDQSPRWGARALAFLAPIVPIAAGIGLLNYRLYGSPLESGYGAASALYALANVPGNVQRYWTWLLDSHSVLVLIALVPVVLRSARPAWLTFSTAAPAMVFAATLYLSYVFYIPFDGWWYLRFLLPAFPLLFILIAAALAWMMRSLPAPLGVPLVLLVFGFMLVQWLGFVADRGVNEVGPGEQRAVAVARYIERELPPHSAVLSMHHSGTLRFYADRLTIRYDAIDPAWLRRTIDWLAGRGYRPYVLLENWEEEIWRGRFPQDDALGRLEVPLIAMTTEHVPIRIYDPLGSGRAAGPPQRIAIPRTRECREPRGAWAR